VLIHDQNDNPMPNTTVRLIFGPQAEESLYWCPGQSHPVVEEMTDESSVAHFCIHLGGCYRGDVDDIVLFARCFLNGCP